MMANRDNELDDAPAWLQDAVEQLRAPVPRATGAVDAVVRAALASVTPEPVTSPARPHSVPRRFLDWLTRPELRLSPLAAAALVILLVGSALWVGRSSRERTVAEATAEVPVRHQFVLVAPRATSVSLVGDFNGWRIGATQLERQGSVWTVEVALPPGRHVYSFVVDGERWVPDASAPRAPEDDFGRPNSVILVPRRRT